MTTRKFDLDEYKASVAAGKPLAVVAGYGKPNAVRVLCIDGGGSHPIVGIHDGDACTWATDGTFAKDMAASRMDLVFATPREYSDAECDAWIKPVWFVDAPHLKAMSRNVARYALQQIDLAKSGRA